MNMNKKLIVITSLLLLIFCSFMIIDASAATTTLRHEYVGVNVCEEESVKKILVLVGYIIVFAKIAVPLILVVLGSLDLYKGVVGKDEKDLMTGLKTFVFRLVAGILIFFLPTIINYAFDLIYETAGGSTNHCVTCILDTNNC